MKIYSVREFREKLSRDADAGPVIEADGQKFKIGMPAMIAGLRCEDIDGMPCLVIYHQTIEGETFGVIMDRQYANELLQVLGPNPMVEQFFKVH